MPNYHKSGQAAPHSKALAYAESAIRLVDCPWAVESHVHGARAGIEAITHGVREDVPSPKLEC